MVNYYDISKRARKRYIPFRSIFVVIRFMGKVQRQLTIEDIMSRYPSRFSVQLFNSLTKTDRPSSCLGVDPLSLWFIGRLGWRWGIASLRRSSKRLIIQSALLACRRTFLVLHRFRIVVLKIESSQTSKTTKKSKKAS